MEMPVLDLTCCLSPCCKLREKREGNKTPAGLGGFRVFKWKEVVKPALFSPGEVQR